MSQEAYKLNVQDMVSISPSKICKTVSITKSYKNSLGYWEYTEKPKTQPNENPSPLKRQFHNFNISENSARRLKQKIEYLFLYARKRNIITYNGKRLQSFKVCFLTLTLPSIQQHNTGILISTCLDSFLQTLRKRLGMKNYVWRLEFQSNGNAHFHICTDTYIDYYFAKKHWNKALNSLGYIDRYTEKMSELTYNQYCERFGKNYKGEKISNDIMYKRWQSGVKSKWKSPNTVDVKNARSSDNIGFYISKYFSKKEKSSKKNQLDTEENSFAIRLCFWSRTLSRMMPESMPAEYYNVDIIDLLDNDESVIKCVFDYCVVYYYDIKKLNPFLRTYLLEFFEKLKVEEAYQSA